MINASNLVALFGALIFKFKSQFELLENGSNYDGFMSLFSGHNNANPDNPEERCDDAPIANTNSHRPSFDTSNHSTHFTFDTTL